MKIGRNARVAVIGAGPSGITAAKHVLQAGVTNLVVFEKNDQVGGNWVYSDDVGHSSVYETAHIISSKHLSQYADYPMPDDYPDYPNHALLKDYFQGYARDFGIMPYIRFNTGVERVDKLEGERWRLTLDDGTTEDFDHLLVANGHHWNPRYPDFEGDFAGEYTHSHHYRTHLPYKDKRVLVIGGGNSACDVAVDISRHASFTAISWRRGYYVVPKFVFGNPPDVVNAKLAWLPRAIRKRLNKLTWRIVVGDNTRYGLQEPDHDLLDAHPVVNSELLYKLRHGDIAPRVNVARYEGNTVHFVDGTHDDYDVVICATGYKITFPFFDEDFIDFSEGDVPLYLRVFPEAHPSLYFIGLVQPQGCIWPLAEAQSQIVANHIIGNYQRPADIGQRIRDEVDAINRRYVKAARHTIEVEYHEYIHRLHAEVPAHAPTWTGAPQPAPTGVS
jgi:hypothetical protein